MYIYIVQTKFSVMSANTTWIFWFFYVFAEISFPYVYIVHLRIQYHEVEIWRASDMILTKIAVVDSTCTWFQRNWKTWDDMQSCSNITPLIIIATCNHMNQ